MDSTWFKLGRALWIERGVVYTQARGSWGAIHIGGTLFRILIGKRDKAWRLELFTRYQRFRFSRA